MTGAPYMDATVCRESAPTYDTGGSITAPGTVTSEACRVQFDTVTQAMRQEDGFLQSDVQLIVLASGLGSAINTEARIVVASGDRAGTWRLMTVERDPAGIGYVCRARKQP